MVIHLVAAWYTNVASGGWWAQFLHPGQLRDRGGYWAWSGIVGDLSMLAGFGAIAKHLNCHQPRCWRRGPLLHAASGSRWCHHHAPADLKAAHPLRHVHWPHEHPMPPFVQTPT